MQIYQESCRLKQKPELEELNRLYWQFLSLATFRKKDPDADLQYSFPDRVHFDFGIWCGEQFFDDPEVTSFLSEYEGNKEGAWTLIYEECCDQLKSWNVEAPLYTITSWLQSLEKKYRILAEAEYFTIPPEVLKQLPPSSNSFIKLRGERRNMLSQLKVFMAKAPGFHEKLIQLIISGNLHDQMDFMKARPKGGLAEQKSLAQVNQLWEDCSSKLRRLFAHPQIINLFDRIETASQQIQTLITRFKIDANGILNEAKKLYLQQTASQKRLTRDLMLMRTNLNMGSRKNSGHAYHSMAQKWPAPINLDDFQFIRKHCFEFDRTASENTPIIFAPGLERSFYEFDHGVLMMPLYSQQTELDLTEALAERFFTIATLKNNQELLGDFEKICGEGKKIAAFKSLYCRWMKYTLNSSHRSLNEEELQFAKRHIAPVLAHVFLRDEESNMDQQHMIELITRWKQGKLAPIQHRKVAAIFLAKERYKEAAQVLKDLAIIYPQQARIEIPLWQAFSKAGQKNEADAILNKWRQEKNSGYYGDLIKGIIQENAHES